MKRREIMKRNVLLVYAHPEPTSLTRQLVDVTVQTLQEQGHGVMLSDLYGMRWKAVFDEHDFPTRVDSSRLSFVTESGHAYATGRQTADVTAEQQKLLASDALILQFPLWWFGMPAILKGWVDRVFAYGLAYGYKGEGNRYRYGDGGFKGKRAMLSLLAARHQWAAGATAVPPHPRNALFRWHGCPAHPCSLRNQSYHGRRRSRSEDSLAVTSCASLRGRAHPLPTPKRRELSRRPRARKPSRSWRDRIDGSHCRRVR